MRVLPAAALALTLCGAAPALALQAEAPAAAPAAEKSAEELAIEADARALRDALVRMQDELVAAWPDGDFDAIIAPYRVQAGALADRMSALLTARAEAAADTSERAALEAERESNMPKIRAMPDTIAQVVLRALGDPQPAPTPAPPSKPAS